MQMTTQQDLLDFLNKLKPKPQGFIDELTEDYEVFFYGMDGSHKGGLAKAPPG